MQGPFSAAGPATPEHGPCNTRPAERVHEHGLKGKEARKMLATIDTRVYEFFDRKKRILFLAFMCYAAMC